MKRFLVRLWKDEDGAEMVEWVVVVGLIAAAAAVVYAAGFTDPIVAALANILP